MVGSFRTSNQLPRADRSAHVACRRLRTSNSDTEDFTLRSAEVAGELADRHVGPDRADHLRDAICSHTTPGSTVARDGAEAFYVQQGALCDLGGLRGHVLAREFVDRTADRHPRAGLVQDILPRIAAEAAAVPDGRFALARRLGFGVAIRLAPNLR